MTEEQAKQLSVGTRVIWDNDPEDAGSVTEVSRNGFFVVWDNESPGGWIDFRDAEPVRRSSTAGT